jgi:tetratricopeptide (TPR) repeat protein
MEVADPTTLHVAVPAGIRAVIARRIGHLDALTAEVLQLAAVIGPEFGQDVLRRVGGYGPEIVDRLDAAVGSKLLAPVPGVRGQYRFFHGLVRETLYDDLAPGRRARLHGRIGLVLEELQAGDDARLPELAFHFGMAAHGDEDGADAVEAEPVVPKAIEYARRAADSAAQSLAYEEAARLYRMALAALDIEPRGDGRARLDVLLALGDVEGRAGNFDTARSAFLDAAAIARGTGDGVGMARAALGVGGRIPWAREGHDTRLAPLLQDALVLLGGHDEPLRARLLTRLACAWRSSPERRDDSAALSRQAVEIARGLDDRASLSNALTGQYWATFWPDNTDDRIASAAEVERIAKDLEDGEMMTDAQLMSVTILIEQGRLVEARRESAALGRIIGELRQPAYRWIEQTNEALLALIAGDYAEAEVWIGREIDTPYRLLPAHDDVSAARSHRYLLRREQGRVAEEETSMREAAERSPWYPYLRAELVCLLLDLGRTAEARSMFDALAHDSFAAFYPDNEWLFGMSLVSESCARFEDAPGAETLYRRLLPYAGRHAVGYGDGSIGVVDRYLGLLAAALGRLDDAIEHLGRAVDLNGQMGSRPWSAHSQHDLAGVLRRRADPGDVERADELDSAALATASQLGMALAESIEPRSAAGTHPKEANAAITAATFRNEGEYWTIEFGSDAFRLRDSRGMRHLSRLLASPGHEIHALELARSGAVDALVRPVGEDLDSDGLGDAGPRLDATAIAAYKARLDELRDELTEADSWHDVERASRLRAEEQALAHELAAAHGLGGRDRPEASAAERARVSATRAIRASLDRIGRQSTTLGAHFDATIRTGTFCSYSPDPRAPLTWRL